MNPNIAGGIAAAAALGVIFYFGAQSAPTPVAPPAPPPAVEKPVVKPAEPVKPVKPASAKPAKPDAAVVYHRVDQGGKRGPETACTSVKPFAEGKSPAEQAVLAKQYGVTVAELQKYHICIN